MDIEIQGDQIQVLALAMHDLENLITHIRAELANVIPPTVLFNRYYRLTLNK